MYSQQGGVIFRNPFPDTNSNSLYTPQAPYAAYTNLNRPPTPPPEMNSAHYGEHAYTRQERGYDSVVAGQIPYKYVDHQTSRPRSPRRPSVSFEPEQPRRASQANAIAPSFQIPKAVNDSGGSLSELAAEITCLFWFESSDLLQQIEESTVPITPTRSLAKDAIPTTGFKKWVTTILSTTLVGANVVILALLFIHRLKKLNPSVKGKPGSEYRLLTVALMLGNKFLDDNTYTNKTWAEVSGINVSEVHIMEVEFLSNMKYCLYTSSDEWAKWQALLGRFAAYFEKAQLPIVQRVPPPILPPASSLRIPIALPSPPASTQASSPYNGDMSGSFTHGITPAQSPLALAPVTTSRKRSFDDHAAEPPAKRIVYASDLARAAALTAPTMPLYAPQLPPLTVPARAMGLVYPAVASAFGTPAHTSAMPVLPQPQPPRYHSPYAVAGTEADAAANKDLSPSVFLRQRSSPYRPVHNVSTLLYPPPSAALQQRPQNIEQSQMHYQPLSKQAQLHTGRLPYIGQVYYDPAQQGAASARQWLPPPVFQQRPLPQ